LAWGFLVCTKLFFDNTHEFLLFFHSTVLFTRLISGITEQSSMDQHAYQTTFVKCDFSDVTILLFRTFQRDALVARQAWQVRFSQLEVHLRVLLRRFEGDEFGVFRCPVTRHQIWR